MESFRRQRTTNDELRRLQDNLALIFQQTQRNPIIDGRLVDGIEITTSGATVDHKLGRALRGWIIVRKSADVRVWDTQADNTNPDKTLTLDASGSATISIWVF